jgi:hypothetical protein
MIPAPSVNILMDSARVSGGVVRVVPTDRERDVVPADDK